MHNQEGHSAKRATPERDAEFGPGLPGIQPWTYDSCLTRRAACQALGAAAAAFLWPIRANAAPPAVRTYRYILSSAMYATFPLDEVLAQTSRIGAEEIDIWARPHSDHREALEKLGEERFAERLHHHRVRLGVLTNYPQGPFGQVEEMKLARRLGGQAVLCGTTGPSEPKGPAAREAVTAFLEKLRPHVEQAEDLGITLLLENHDRQLLHTPDSIRYFAELNRSPRLKLAYAIHHMQTADSSQIAPLVEELGNDQIGFIYFQEQGAGLRNRVPREEEFKQLPGFGGGLDYRPIMAALKKIQYRGWIEIFMHPTPRGIPVMPTPTEVTDVINRARNHVEQFME